jgi:hypothetical protein
MVFSLIRSNGFRFSCTNRIRCFFFQLLVFHFYFCQVPNLALMFISNVFILIALFIETKLGNNFSSFMHYLHCLSARQQISERTGTICTIINLTVELLLPVACVVGFRTHPIPSCFTLGIYVCIFLKLISYAHVNYWCRKAAIAASQPKSSHHSPKDRAKSPELRHSSSSSSNMNGNWLMYGQRDAVCCSLLLFIL